MPAIAQLVTPRMIDILSCTRQMPWASAYEMDAWGTPSVSQFQKGLQSMRRAGLVTSVKMGMTRRVQERWRLDEMGMRHQRGLNGEPVSWDFGGKAIEQLPDQLPMVEMAYFALGRVTKWLNQRPDTGAETGARTVFLIEFCWLPDGPVRAIARFNNRAVVAFLWAGKKKSPGDLYQSLLRQFRDWDHVPPAGWWDPDEEPDQWTWEPSLWVVVAEDEWAIDRARDGLFRAGVELDRVAEICPGYEYFPDAPVQGSVGTLRFRSGRVRPGNPAITRRLPEDERFQALNGMLRYRVFGVVEAWPACRISDIARFCRETVSNVKAVVDDLVAAGLVDQFGNNMYLTEDAHIWVRRRDGVALRRVRHKNGELRYPGHFAELDSNRTRMLKHDQSLAHIASRFAASGARIFAGPRGVVNLAGQTQLDPDAVLLLNTPDSAETRFYLEYERAAKADSTVERKLRPYHEYRELNQGNAPALLVVVEDEDVEPIFWAKAGTLTLFTATRSAVVRGPVVGASTVFRRDDSHAALFVR